MAWILSLILCMRGRRRYLPLCILFAITVSEELIVAWMVAKKLEFIWIYHIYALFEYTLLCLYFMQITPPKIRKLVRYSIPLFAIISLSISQWLYHYAVFPGANINTEGIFLCIICTYVLLNLDIHEFSAIHKNPDFWISLGLLVFFAGTFFSNGLFTYILDLDQQRALQLFSIINKPFNLILYACFIIGFLCAIPRTSTLRLS
ncbi:MAG: hypothetical protein JNK79_19690 [Chitinophagaceae bacterium]|nr:hypothetical protein [Chitinophagaceae bacterium]